MPVRSNRPGSNVNWVSSATTRSVFGVVSFTLEQVFYLHETANLVPKWTSAWTNVLGDRNLRRVALAAIALLTGFTALLASRLTTAMIVGFGLLVRLPALFSDPQSFENWSETADNRP